MLSGGAKHVLIMAVIVLFFLNDINNMHVRCVMADDRLLAKQK